MTAVATGAQTKGLLHDFRDFPARMSTPSCTNCIRSLLLKEGDA